jgi:hypothetical protein
VERRAYVLKTMIPSGETPERGTSMYDDKSQRLAHDAARVNVNERYELAKHARPVDIDDPEEVRYCTRWQLIMAVAKVGFTTSALEEELKQRC